MEPEAELCVGTERREANAVMDRLEDYRRFAAECLEMARTLHSPTAQERTVLIEMALLWSRLAEREAERASAVTES